MSSNLSELSGRKGLEENLFEQLGRISKAEQTMQREGLEKLAEEFLIGKANTYGSASFYDFTREENRNKKIYVCNGSACLCAGTQDEVHKKIAQRFEANEIGEMCCLGRCYENAAFHYSGKNYSGQDIEQLDQILEGTQENKKIHAVAHGTPVLCSEPLDVNEYKKILQDVMQRGPDVNLNQLKNSGLRGRGGAGFPTAIKLESCRNTASDIRFIVCNADEGDPGAFSDRYLLEQQCMKVLCGIQLAGLLCGATQGVLYIRAEYPESIAVTEACIQKLYAENLCGEAIFGSDFSFHFKVIHAQGAYICGEETALLSSIEGQRPEVRVRPPYPAQKGLFNKPTVVCNVETLACIPYILKNETESFSSIGFEKSTGTKLISLDGYFNSPGIYEVDMGTPLVEVIEQCGTGFRVPVKALHIGGPLGGLVPVHKIPDLNISFERFQQEGFLLGHASVVCIPESFPLIAYIEHLFRFTAHESCGKCFPCRIGSTRGYELIEKARTSDVPIDVTLFSDLLETLETGSLCALGGGLPLPVKNALHYFKEELSPYFG